VDRRVQLAFAWCGLIGGGLIGVGLVAVAGIVPAPSAADTAAQIAAYYRTNADQLRAGLLMAMVGAPLMIPFLVLIALQLKASDRRLAPLAYTQLVAGTTFFLMFLIPVLLWGAAVFRPDRPAAGTQLINDVGSTIFYWAFSPGSVEVAAAGIAVLMDRSERPLFPRWLGYLDLAVAVAYAGGAPAVFFKTGAFGWDGLFALWLPFAGFSAWLASTFVTSVRAIDAHREQPAT
jgi:hypothetical protein